jgi:CRP/FNR family transcriptional regulator
MSSHRFQSLGNQLAETRPRGVGNPCEACPVRDMSVCATLSGEELDRMNALVTRMRVDREKAVFYEWDAAEHVYNVTEGTVRLSKMLADGRRQVTGFVGPGDFLGIAYSDTYAYTAEAVTPLSLCRFPRRRLEALFDEMPGLEKRVLGVASNELRAAQDQMLLLGRKTAVEKLSTFLWKWTQHALSQGGSLESIDLPMNRTDIADYLGLTTETVSRTFTRLVKADVLELRSIHHVVLRDAERLQELTEGQQG